MTALVQETSVTVVRRFLDALNTWDFDVMAELFDSDLVFELPFAPPGLVTRIEGGREFLEFVRRVPEVFDEERLHDIAINGFADDPHEVVAEYQSDMNVVATGGKYQNRYVARFTVRDGKLTRFVEYCDPIPLLEALGGRVEFDGSGSI
jgi:uncharacterized protein